MNLRNYTSNVPVETTVARIEARLAAAGASGIMKLYGPDKRISSLCFHFETAQRNFQIKVPANSEACYQSMLKEHLLAHPKMMASKKETLREQANRTAWKLVHDWIDVQISMIVMDQAEFLQVFMPYLWDGKQTYFEAVKGGGFKALAERSEAA
jgi:hypothetical protein